VRHDPDQHAALGAEFDQEDPFTGPAGAAAGLPDAKHVGVEGTFLEIRHQLGEPLASLPGVSAGAAVGVTVGMEKHCRRVTR
jgi:hypothetical protein